MFLGMFMFIVYEDFHFGTCPLVKPENNLFDVFFSYSVEQTMPFVLLLDRTHTITRFYNHWGFGKSEKSLTRIIKKMFAPEIAKLLLNIFEEDRVDETVCGHDSSPHITSDKKK
jgi:hypothetical protein